MSVRVRFAPSPTGSLHIGSARTALFNWLFARHEKGVFILRVEDTDVVRSEESHMKTILDSLEWLGLDWDEGPLLQSSRFELYDDFAKKLLHQDKAYLDEGAVRLRMPKKKMVVKDLIHGEMVFDLAAEAQFEDLVITKSNGTPTYNFACVVDDALMKITHVIRGDDHISNTPKQLAIYEALNFPVPLFAHIPLILGEDRSRLSKRTGATSITEFRDLGYLPEAIVNYLALLGWSPKNNREVVPPKELIEEFSIVKVNKNAAIFNSDKLDWINLQYMKEADAKRLVKLTRSIFEKEGFSTRIDDQHLEAILTLFKTRLKTLRELLEMGRFLFTEEVRYDEAAAKELLGNPKLASDFQEIARRLDELSSFEAKRIEGVIRGYIAERNIPAKEIIHPVRVAVTGGTVSPGLFELLAVTGKEKTVKNLRFAADWITSQQK
ncbi:MAG: glutamate--tRNA ligase [Candidatus Omnitrophica bacterium]|nr:glutamate--tRNA ligase [Candidatus Omnitrophota bacterium]